MVIKMAERINKDNFGEKVLGSDIPILVDFYSDSCVPCKMLSPVLGDIEEEQEGKLAVVKVNVNFDTELAEEYKVLGAPTLVLFWGGKEIARRSGAARKPELTGWLEEHLAEK